MEEGHPEREIGFNFRPHNCKWEDQHGKRGFTYSPRPIPLILGRGSERLRMRLWLGFLTGEGLHKVVGSVPVHRSELGGTVKNIGFSCVPSCFRERVIMTQRIKIRFKNVALSPPAPTSPEAKPLQCQ